MTSTPTPETTPAREQEAEELARDWLDRKYLNVEAGHDPNDRDYGTDDMVDAYIAGRSAALASAGKPGADAVEDESLSEADLALIDWGWETHKAAVPVAKVINNNQPGRTTIIEVLVDPPTLDVGTLLYREPARPAQPATTPAETGSVAVLVEEHLEAISGLRAFPSNEGEIEGCITAKGGRAINHELDRAEAAFAALLRRLATTSDAGVRVLDPVIVGQIKVLQDKAAETLWLGTPLLKGLVKLLQAHGHLPSPPTATETGAQP